VIRTSELVLDGVRTRALSVEGDGPAFLFLHGYTDSADTWRYVLAELAKRGRAAVAVDMPSHGRAGPHADAPILPQLRRFASAFAERYPGSVLAGNSLGGLASLLAAEDPELPVAGVVAIGPAGVGYQRWFLALKPLIFPLMLSSYALPPVAARVVLGQAYVRMAFGKPPPRAALDRYAAHFSSRERVRGLIRMVDRLKTEAMPGCLVLERVEAPLLLLWGARDWLVPVASSDEMRQYRPDADLIVWDDCAHCPQLDVPERMADCLMSFADDRGP
jgi:pimeloyl-ACP methyl ester carboxylesterase